MSQSSDSNGSQEGQQFFITQDTLEYFQQLAKQSSSKSLKILKQLFDEQTSFKWYKHLLERTDCDLLGFFAHSTLRELMKSIQFSKQQCQQFISWAKYIIDFSNQMVPMEINQVFAREVAVFYRYQLNDVDAVKFLDLISKNLMEIKQLYPRLVMVKIMLEVLEVMKVNPSNLEKKNIKSNINHLFALGFKVYTALVLPTDDEDHPYVIGYQPEYKSAVIEELIYSSLLLIKECLQFDFLGLKKQSESSSQEIIQNQFWTDYSPICIPMKPVEKKEALFHFSVFKNNRLADELFFVYNQVFWPPLKSLILEMIGSMVRIFPKFFMIGGRQMNSYVIKINEIVNFLVRFSRQKLFLSGNEDIDILIEFGKTLKKSVVFNKVVFMRQDQVQKVVENVTHFFEETFFNNSIFSIKILAPYLEYFDILEKFKFYSKSQTANNMKTSIRYFKMKFLGCLLDTIDIRRQNRFHTIPQLQNLPEIMRQMEEDMLLDEALMEQILATMKFVPTQSMEEEETNVDAILFYRYTMFEKYLQQYKDNFIEEYERKAALDNILRLIVLTIKSLDWIKIMNCRIPNEEVIQAPLNSNQDMITILPKLQDQKQTKQHDKNNLSPTKQNSHDPLESKMQDEARRKIRETKNQELMEECRSLQQKFELGEQQKERQRQKSKYLDIVQFEQFKNLELWEILEQQAKMQKKILRYSSQNEQESKAQDVKNDEDSGRCQPDLQISESISLKQQKDNFVQQQIDQRKNQIPLTQTTNTKQNPNFNKKIQQNSLANFPYFQEHIEPDIELLILEQQYLFSDKVPIQENQTIKKHRLFLHFVVSKLFEAKKQAEIRLPFNKIIIHILAIQPLDHHLLCSLLTVIRRTQTIAQQTIDYLRKKMHSLWSQSGQQKKQQNIALKHQNQCLIYKGKQHESSIQQKYSEYLQHLKLFSLICQPTQLLNILSIVDKRSLCTLLAVFETIQLNSYFQIADTVTDLFMNTHYPHIVNLLSKAQIYQFQEINQILQIFNYILKINRHKNPKLYKKDYLLCEVSTVIQQSVHVLSNCENLDQQFSSYVQVFHNCIYQLIGVSYQCLRMQNRLFSTQQRNPYYRQLSDQVPKIIKIINSNPSFWIRQLQTQKQLEIQKYIIEYMETFISFKPNHFRFLFDENIQNIIFKTIPLSVPFLTRYTQHPTLYEQDKQILIKKLITETMTSRQFTHLEWVQFVKLYKTHEDVIDRICNENNFYKEYINLVYTFQDISISRPTLFDYALVKLQYLKTVQNRPELNEQNQNNQQENINDQNNQQQQQQDDEYQDEQEETANVNQEQIEVLSNQQLNQNTEQQIDNYDYQQLEKQYLQEHLQFIQKDKNQSQLIQEANQQFEAQIVQNFQNEENNQHQIETSNLKPEYKQDNKIQLSSLKEEYQIVQQMPSQSMVQNEDKNEQIEQIKQIDLVNQTDQTFTIKQMINQTTGISESAVLEQIPATQEVLELIQATKSGQLEVIKTFEAPEIKAVASQILKQMRKSAQKVAAQKVQQQQKQKQQQLKQQQKENKERIICDL